MLIAILKIEMETGIASSSIRPIGPNSVEIIEVKDWEDINQDGFDVDL